MRFALPLLLLVLLVSGCSVFTCDSPDGCIHLSATPEEQKRALEKGRDEHSLAMKQSSMQDAALDSVAISEEDKNAAEVVLPDTIPVDDKLDLVRLEDPETPLVLLPDTSAKELPSDTLQVDSLATPQDSVNVDSLMLNLSLPLR